MPLRGRRALGDRRKRVNCGKDGDYRDGREYTVHHEVKNKIPKTTPPSKDEIGSDGADDQEGLKLTRGLERRGRCTDQAVRPAIESALGESESEMM